MSCLLIIHDSNEEAGGTCKTNFLGPKNVLRFLTLTVTLRSAARCRLNILASVFTKAPNQSRSSLRFQYLDVFRIAQIDLGYVSGRGTAVSNLVLAVHLEIKSGLYLFGLTMSWSK